MDLVRATQSVNVELVFIAYGEERMLSLGLTNCTADVRVILATFALTNCVLIATVNVAKFEDPTLKAVGLLGVLIAYGKDWD